MLNRCQVFDSRKIRYSTRKRVTRYTGVLITTAVFALTATCMVTYWLPDSPMWAILLDAIWLVPIGYLGYKIYRLSSVAWCVKVYPDRIEGYDYARRKTVLPWDAVEAVDFADKYVRLAGNDGQRIHISHAFPHFSKLGEHILDHTLQSDIPLSIEGEEWSSIDIQREFPFLSNVTRARS